MINSQRLKLRLQGAIDTSVMSTLKERARRDNPVIERRVAMTEAEVYFETNNRSLYLKWGER